MLNYKVGDLCLAAIGAEVNVIAHQANCFCTMKSGVAKRISELFPEAVQADAATVKGEIAKLGTFSVGTGKNCFGSPFPIYNIYGQYKYGVQQQHTDYDALSRAFRGIAFRLYPYRNKIKIGLPKIGAGLGGGDWDVISKIIERELKAFDVTIYVLSENQLPTRDSVNEN